MGIAGGCKFSSSANVVKHKIGALGGTPLTNGVSVAGATTIVTDGWTSSVAACLKAGDIISIASVNAVNPQTRQSTGELAQFIVTADGASDGDGNMTITIDRAIYASGQYQNVDALPDDGAAITVFGHASTYANVIAPQNLVYYKQAYAIGVADLELPDAGVKATRASDKDAGLSLTMTEAFDIVNYRMIHRIDFLGGWKCIYPEFGCRVVGQP